MAVAVRKKGKYHLPYPRDNDNSEKKLIDELSNHYFMGINRYFETVNEFLKEVHIEKKERKCECYGLSKTQYEKLEKELQGFFLGWEWDEEKKMYKCDDPLIAKFIPEETETEINEKGCLRSYLSKTQYERLKEILQDVILGKWKWDENKKMFVSESLLLGEYIPGEKKVVLYVKNIEDACYRDKVKPYCGVLATYIHELFHASHHRAAEKTGRKYNPIREIEEAVTEFSTLSFIREVLVENGNEWKEVFDWAFKSIKEKQLYLGVFPAYGFGLYLFNAIPEHEVCDWIDRYEQKLCYLNRSSRYVKWCQQMLCPKYPFKDEKLCFELFNALMR